MNIVDLLAPNEEAPITATIIPDVKRTGFLPSVLPKHFQDFENRTYNVLSRIARTYCGGYWEFFQLSNGGFYIAPTGYDVLHIEVASNGYSGNMSGDAAGIVASLYALNALCWLTPSERLNVMYHLLRDFACERSEARAILGAID